MTTSPSARYVILQSKIGRGSYGVVSRYRDTTQNPPGIVAIKKMRLSLITPKDDAERQEQKKSDIQRFIRELSALNLLNHSNIIHLQNIEISKQDTHYVCFLVFEHYPTDLNNVIKSPQRLTKDHVEYVMLQIFRATAYMHSAGIMHRDIKPANILINEECDIKICDFGLARLVPSEALEAAENTSSQTRNQSATTDMTEYVATRWYRAPELFLRCKNAVDKPIDMWGIGCVFAELILRTYLFPGDKTEDMLPLIFKLVGAPNADNCEWIDKSTPLEVLSWCSTNQAKLKWHSNKVNATAPQNFIERFIDRFENTIQYELTRLSLKEISPNFKIDPDIVKDIPLLDLLMRLLEPNPKKRITANLAGERLARKRRGEFRLASQTTFEKERWETFEKVQREDNTFLEKAFAYIDEEEARYHPTSQSAPSSSVSTAEQPLPQQSSSIESAPSNTASTAEPPLPQQAASIALAPTESSPLSKQFRPESPSRTKGTIFHFIEPEKTAIVTATETATAKEAETEATTTPFPHWRR